MIFGLELKMIFLVYAVEMFGKLRLRKDFERGIESMV